MEDSKPEILFLSNLMNSIVIVSLGPLEDTSTVQNQLSGFADNYRTDALDYQTQIANQNTGLGGDITTLQTSLEEIWKRLESSLDDIEDMMDTVRKLEHYLWNKECQVKTSLVKCMASVPKNCMYYPVKAIISTVLLLDGRN